MNTPSTAVHTRASTVRTLTHALAAQQDWGQAPARCAQLLLCLTEAGVRTGGLSARDLASDIALRLESAILRDSGQSFAWLLCQDTQKYLIRHINEATEGDPGESLEAILAAAGMHEVHVLSYAGSLLEELSSAIISS